MSVSEAALGKITEFVAGAEKHPKAARFFLLNVAQTLLTEERIRVCHRVRIPTKETVDIVLNRETDNARYCGLMKCGLSWICPLCNNRIAEQRREILDRAFQNARGVYAPVMVTYTIRHDLSMRLAGILDQMHNAYRKIRQSRQWRVTKEEWSIFGEIRATEITYSFVNGWHAHYHVLVITSKEQVIEEEQYCRSLENQMFLYWHEFLQRENLDCSREHGVDVRPASFANHYVAKIGDWSVSKELTRVMSKHGRSLDNVTMFDMLLLHYAGAEEAAGLFREYHCAVKGRSSLQWSPKLKTMLGVSALHENAIDDPPLSDAEVILMRLTPKNWRSILENGAAGHVLDLAAEGDYEKLARFILSLTSHVV